MAKKAEPSRVAAALQYLQQMRDRAADFGGGVVDTLADRARDVGGLAYEAFTSDPNIGRMTTAEYAQAADRPTPRLDQAAQDLGTIGKAIVTQPVQTGKALVQGEVERARQAMTSPRAAGEYAGSMVDPMRIAAALRKTAPIAELDVYHGTPHRFPETEANPLGEFDASKIGTGEGEQAFGYGIYLAESPSVAQHYSTGGGGFVPVQGKDNVYFNGQWVQDFSDKKSPEGLAKYAMSQSSTGTTIKEKTETLNKIGRKDAADWLEKNADKFNQSKGNLYTADLPDEMIDRMLDWEKPLSEQSEFVKAAIRAMPNAPDESKWKNWTGEYLYRIHLQRGGRESPEKPLKVTASEKLQNASIPGIKYLDAGSRSRGLSATGTRNFVVFPGEEKKVKILERK
jgi:hypothetical protein